MKLSKGLQKVLNTLEMLMATGYAVSRNRRTLSAVLVAGVALTATQASAQIFYFEFYEVSPIIYYGTDDDPCVGMKGCYSEYGGMIDLNSYSNPTLAGQDWYEQLEGVRNYREGLEKARKKQEEIRKRLYPDRPKEQ